MGLDGSQLYIASFSLGEDSGYLLSPPWSDRQPFTKSGLAPVSRREEGVTRILSGRGEGTRIGPGTLGGASDPNVQQKVTAEDCRNDNIMAVR